MSSHVETPSQTKSSMYQAKVNTSTGPKKLNTLGPGGGPSFRFWGALGSLEPKKGTLLFYN